MEIQNKIKSLNNLKLEYLKWLKKNDAQLIRYYTPPASEAHPYYETIVCYINTEHTHITLKIYRNVCVIEFESNNKYYITTSIDDFKKEILNTPF